jgi:hypothetical protein
MIFKTLSLNPAISKLSAQLVTRAGSSSAYVSDHRTTKAYRPTVLAVREKYSFQRMFSAASFRSPMQATVIRVDNGPFGANGPAFNRVQKLYIKQIGSNTGGLLLPSASAVNRVVDTAAAPNRPTHTIVNK